MAFCPSYTSVSANSSSQRTPRVVRSLNPCDADGLFNVAYVLVNRGRHQESLEWFERAKDINPMWPGNYDNGHSLALFHLGQYEQSVRLLSRVPRLGGRQEMRLAATYALMGERDLARLHVERAQSLAPSRDFVEWARTDYPFEQDRDLQRLIDGINLALEMRDGS